MSRSRLSCLVVALAALSAGCASNGGQHTEPAAAEAPSGLAALTEAVAVVHPTTGNSAHGVVRFVQTADGMHVTAEIEGLKPNAHHAFHIHEFGDCTSGDGKSAGGHYNPEGHPHAGPDAAARHAGDLGNLDADANGVAHYDRTIAGFTVGGHHDPILGRSVIVHLGEDDFTTQPTGNAGDRIACGVIGVAKPAAK